MPKAIKTALQFILFLGIGIAILYYLYYRLNQKWQADCIVKGIADCPPLIDKLIADFATVNPFWIAIVIGCFVLSNVSRALRWNMMIRPLGYSPKFSNAFWTIMLGYGANLLLPRLGEVVRIGTMAKHEDIPVSKVAGTVVLDRLVDAVCLISMVVLAFVLEADRLLQILHDNMGENPLQSRILWVLLGIGMLILVALWMLRKSLARFPFYQRMRKLLLGFAEGLRSIGKLSNPAMFIFHTLAIWGMYYLMTYFCFFSYAPTAHLSPVAGLVTFVVGAFGIVIPSPGGLGTYHFLVTEALMLYEVPEVNGFIFANIAFFSINLFCNVLLGFLAFLILPRINQ